MPSIPAITGFIGVVVAGALACAESTAPEDKVPASLDVVSGQEQSGRVNEWLPEPIVARVLNAAGQPIRGQVVNFVVLKGGGSVFAGTAITNEDGLAQDRWTIGKSVADSQVVEARAVDAGTGAPLVFARFVATALPGPPSSIEKVSGDQQAAVVGATLPDSLLVRVLDAYDNPVNGATVAWTVESGKGTLGRASDVTTATGYARTTWTLGDEVGTQRVRAVVGEGVATDFTSDAQAQPPAPTLQITKYAGDAQTAAPGSAVPVPPSVRVTDTNGEVHAGVTVTFTVASGGGTVTGATATSDASGVAAVGSWVLGNQAGVNTLSASMSTGSPVTFSATAASASPDITLDVRKPAPGLVDDNVSVSAQITSRFQLRSVIVAAAGRTATLTLTSPGLWTGTLSLAGTPRDTMTVVTTATDVNGSSEQDIRVVTHDRIPKVIITQPANNAVARPGLQIDASCDDDDPSACTLSARVGRQQDLFDGAPSPLHTSVSLAAFDGKQVEIVITAKDSRGQLAEDRRTVFVESSTHLQVIGTAHSTVEDISDSRLLWWSAGSDGLLTVGVDHMDSGVSDTLLSNFQGNLGNGFLTPTGAAFTTSFSVPPFARLYLWRSGSMSTKDLNSASSLAARGNYIIYTTPPVGYGPLYRMDVTTGTEILLASNVNNTDNSVSDNGDVAWLNSLNEVWRYRGTGAVRMSDDDSQRKNFQPLTDGINVVFLRRPCCTRPEIWLNDGTSLTMLAPMGPSALSPGLSYDVNAGWTAFINPDSAGYGQVWTRSPTGVLRTVSSFGSTSTIRAVGSDGSVVFDVQGDRYFAGPGSAPTRIGSTLGRVVWRDARFVVLLANTAFSINP